jgi:hypothetical protein
MVFFLGLFAIVGGFIMVIPLFVEKNEALRTFNEKLTPYKIIIGLAILIIGAITFIVPYHGNGRSLIPVFGDLLPAVLAILAGLFVSFEFIENLKGAKGKLLEKIRKVLNQYQYPIGFAAMFFGLIHWFLFKVVFL